MSAAAGALLCGSATGSSIPERVRRPLPSILLLLSVAIAASQGLELLVNRALRPDAEEIRWIGDVVLILGLALTWLWMRLRDTQMALTHLERRQIESDAQLAIAARVQTSLLPQMPQESGGISWYAAVEPAHMIGGDYYDLIPLDAGRLGVVLVDVAGKGIGAAVFVASVRATLRTLMRDALSPAVLLSHLSDALLAEAAPGLYLTCIVGIVDPASRSMVYVNAGHPAGVLWNRDGVRALRAGGPPVGLLNNARFTEERVQFTTGDLVVLVSDGITEALNTFGDASVDAIVACIGRAETQTPNGICEGLLGAARQGTGPAGVEDWTDDRTAVAFRVNAAA